MERDSATISLRIFLRNGEDAMFRVEPILIELKNFIEKPRHFSSRDFMESWLSLKAQQWMGELADKGVKIACIVSHI